jgi:hypothetical protein
MARMGVAFCTKPRVPMVQRQIWNEMRTSTVAIGIQIGSHMVTDSENLPRHRADDVVVLEMHKLDLEPWVP